MLLSFGKPGGLPGFPIPYFALLSCHFNITCHVAWCACEAKLPDSMQFLGQNIFKATFQIVLCPTKVYIEKTSAFLFCFHHNGSFYTYWLQILNSPIKSLNNSIMQPQIRSVHTTVNVLGQYVLNGPIVAAHVHRRRASWTNILLPTGR